MRFLLGATLLYAVLIAPWPGLGPGYRAWFRCLGEAVFAHSGGRWYVKFDDIPQGQRRSLDTRITLADRGRADKKGNTPARLLDLDIRGVAWVPTALTVALILATPIPWGRRLRALGAGLVGIHVFIVFALAIYLVDTASDSASGAALIGLAPFWKVIVSGLDELLITQLGAGFVAPVAIWAAATLRSGDFALLLPRQASSSEPAANGSPK